MSVTPGIVTFDPAEFTTDYPAFAKVSDAALNRDFTLAELQLVNTLGSVVVDVNKRKDLLYLLTAHFAALLDGVNGQPPTGMVGRISTASEGSVSVGTEYLTESEQAAFFNQTVWGAAYWASTLIYRTARYFPAACSLAEEFGAFDGWPL